jgi:putative restriction endonuclease
VIDLIEDGTVADNRIPLPGDSLALCEAFRRYWDTFFPENKPDIKQPFVRLANDIPWRLHAHGQEHQLPFEDIKQLIDDGISKSRLNERVSHASFEPELYALLQEEGSRREIRKVLIREYFSPQAWDMVQQHSRTNTTSQSYARWLIEKAKGSTHEDPPTRDVPIREAGFRRAIVGIYAHQCAFCRLSIRSPEEHTVVQAAHIIPWSEGQDDDPRNGLALCGVCHWTFDEGLLSLSDKWHILFSPYLERKDHQIGYLRTLKGTQMLLPEDDLLWPRLASLEWHRTEKFVDVR